MYILYSVCICVSKLYACSLLYRWLVVRIKYNSVIYIKINDMMGYSVQYTISWCSNWLTMVPIFEINISTYNCNPSLLIWDWQVNTENLNSKVIMETTKYLIQITRYFIIHTIRYLVIHTTRCVTIHTTRYLLLDNQTVAKRIGYVYYHELTQKHYTLLKTGRSNQQWQHSVPLLLWLRNRM